MNRLRLIKTAYTALAALMLASCASDELADGTVQDLPDGKYPLQIAGVSVTAESNAEPWGADAPQTRVAEDTDGKGSHWVGGEEITVHLSSTKADNTSYTAEGKYTLGNDKTTLTPVSGKELYWRSTNEGTITAWHCSPAPASDNTVDLSNQSNELAYVLKAEVSGVKYNTNPKPILIFKHQLAKVRIVLSGANSSKVKSVQIESYIQCTNERGTVEGKSVGIIDMCETTLQDGTVCWEANVVPDYTISNIKVNNNANWSTLTTSVTPVAGKYHVITVGVKTITYPVSSPIPDITDNGEYIIEGDGSPTNNGIVIEGSPTITLKNVNISSSLGIEIKSGTPTILIDGSNQLTSSKGSGIALTSENANVIIKGSGSNPTLTVTGGFYQAGIGGNDNPFGNIYIEGITLTAYGHEAAPGIGSGLPAYKGEMKKSGWIYIKNCTVTASGQYDDFYKVSPAAIGNSSIAGGASLEQGDITIENDSMNKEDILRTLTQLSGSHKIGNGTGGNTSAGTITIGTIKIIAKDGTFTDNGVGYIDN